MVWSGVGTPDLAEIFLKALLASMRAAAAEKPRLLPVTELLKEAIGASGQSLYHPQVTSLRAPACGVLDEAMRLMRSRGHRLAAPLVPLLRRLHWNAAVEPTLASVAASADILVKPGIQVGVVLAAPHVQYPMRWRRAHVACVPLSDVLWDVNQRLAHCLLDRELHNIGEVALWQANEPHGFVTAEDPLLLVWMRYGDTSVLSWFDDSVGDSDVPSSRASQHAEGADQDDFRHAQTKFTTPRPFLVEPRAHRQYEQDTALQNRIATMSRLRLNASGGKSALRTLRSTQPTMHF